MGGNPAPIWDSMALHCSWTRHDDLCGSDHFPIIVGCNGCPEEETIERWNFNKADWNKFSQNCSTSIDDSILSEVDPVLCFSTKLIEAAKESIPIKVSKGKQLPKVPWFSEMCKNAVKERKKAQRKYFQNPNHNNFLNWKKEKAKAKLIIKTAKRNSWRNFVSKLNSQTSSKKVWDAIKRIKGRKSNPNIHLKQDGQLINDKFKAANHLAKSFAANSSADHYGNDFQKVKQKEEKVHLDFSSGNQEIYNDFFTISELKEALSKTNLSAAGPDNIYYQFLAHLPDTCISILLEIFNQIWNSGTIPPTWKEATVVPIPKPNRDTSDPTNYRPIALTSCLCKTMERLVNSRLTWELESKNLLSKTQCGFRKQHSTLDHLVRLESFIREAFARKRQVLAVFFDLEKAYDTTWKHGILKDLHELNFRGRLPIFISNFLSNRHFKVKVNSTLSESFPQENGVPQGSILSPILFNIKINNIVKSVLGNVNASLFVDDFALYIEGKHLPYLERAMQLCIDKVQKWVTDNGFKFSTSKTVCIHFHRKRGLLAEPSLFLNKSPIKTKTEAKFLGIIFDQKLSFIPHIKDLKQKCLKAMNILRVLGHTDWGADKETLLKLYRTLIRSKLDYGCAIYGSAKEHALKMLDPIHHQGLRIALGAFRTSPTKSLYVEAKEPSLHHRRIKLSMNYYLKLKSLPDNPAYDCVFGSSPIEMFEKSKSTPSFGARIQVHINKANINDKDINYRKTPSPPTWKKTEMNFDFSLSKLKKDNTNQLIFQKEFLEMREKYSHCFEIYTDGSKQNKNVGAAAYFPKTPEEPLKMRLAENSSVFSAELVGIILALKKVKQLEKEIKNFVIMTDGLSALQSLANPNPNNNFSKRILNLLTTLCPDVNIHFVWIPGHVGIIGNEKADKLAKEALEQRYQQSKILEYSDLKPLTNSYVNNLWQEEWNLEVGNKLREIVKGVTEGYAGNTKNRREETMLSRLRIGHSWLTHGFLLRGEEAPFCHSCDTVFSIRHILVECDDLSEVRRQFFTQTNLFDLFRQVDIETIMKYLSEIRLLNRI